MTERPPCDGTHRQDRRGGRRPKATHRVVLVADNGVGVTTMNLCRWHDRTQRELDPKSIVSREVIR